MTPTKLKELVLNDDFLTYCNLLKQQIAEMTDEDEIKNIKYGDSLNEKYQNMLNQLLGGQNETNS